MKATAEDVLDAACDVYACTLGELRRDQEKHGERRRHVCMAIAIRSSIDPVAIGREFKRRDNQVIESAYFVEQDAKSNKGLALVLWSIEEQLKKRIAKRRAA